MLFPRGKGKKRLLSHLGYYKARFLYPEAAPRQISATFVVSLHKELLNPNFFCMLQQSKKFPSGFVSFTWCKRSVWNRLLGYSCRNELWLVFGMSKWTLASRKGSLKSEVGASATCIPQGENRLEKPKMNTKKIPAWMKEMGWKAFSERKLRRAKEQGCS